MQILPGIALAFITLATFAQTPSIDRGDSITRTGLDSLYIRAIHDRIDLNLTAGHKYFEVTENTVRIKNSIQVPAFKFLTHEELIRKSIRDKQQLNVYRVVHQIISRDTVDINVGVVTVRGKRALYLNHGRLITRKGFFSIKCGGTNGYVPTERFVYNRNTRAWDRVDFVKPV